MHDGWELHGKLFKDPPMDVVQPWGLPWFAQAHLPVYILYREGGEVWSPGVPYSPLNSPWCQTGCKRCSGFQQRKWDQLLQAKWVLCPGSVFSLFGGLVLCLLSWIQAPVLPCTWVWHWKCYSWFGWLWIWGKPQITGGTPWIWGLCQSRKITLWSEKPSVGWACEMYASDVIITQIQRISPSGWNIYILVEWRQGFVESAVWWNTHTVKNDRGEFLWEINKSKG